MRPGTAYQPGIQDFSGQLWLPSALGDGAGGLGPLWNPGTGAVTRPTPAATSSATQLLRAQFANTAANQELGPRFAAAADCHLWKGNAAGLGGFYFSSLFLVEAWANNAARLFVGLASNAAGAVCLADVGAIPASDLVGIYHDTADGANVLQVVAAAGGAAQKVAFNETGTITLAAGQAFKLEMWCYPNTVRVYGLLTDYILGTKLAYFQTDGGPRTNILMGPQCQIGNAANAGAGTFALSVSNVYAVQR